MRGGNGAIVPVLGGCPRVAARQGVTVRYFFLDRPHEIRERREEAAHQVFEAVLTFDCADGRVDVSEVFGHSFVDDVQVASVDYFLDEPLGEIPVADRHGDSLSALPCWQKGRPDWQARQRKESFVV